MEAITKPLAVVMILVGISIVLEELGIYAWNIGIDKIMIGAALFIFMQALNMILLKRHSGQISIMNIFMLIIFIIPLIGYFFSGFFAFGFKDSLPLIIGTMIILESLYALH